MTRRSGDAFVDALFETDWVVYAKPAFGGASAVLRYLGRYTHRVAISNHRLLRLRRRPRHVSVEGLRPRRPAAHDDAVGHGVSATLRPAHSAARLRPHPAVGVSREHLSDGRASRSRARCSAQSRARTPVDARHGDRHADDHAATRVGLPALRSRDDHRPDPLGAPPGGGQARLRHLMTAEPHSSPTGVLVDVVAHVSGVVCLDPLTGIQHLVQRVARRHPSTARAAAARASPAHPIDTRPRATIPLRSSIAGRRASGFLQVSLSKVSRHPPRAARRASRAESLPMNANDKAG